MKPNEAVAPGASRPFPPAFRAVTAASGWVTVAFQALVTAGAAQPGPDHTIVRSGGTPYVVRNTPEGERCTCAWFATHGLDQGLCKHILAPAWPGPWTDRQKL